MTQREFLIGVDFNSQDLSKLKLPTYNGLPTIEPSGSIIFNSADSNIYISDGSNWSEISGGGGNPYVVVNGSNAFPTATGFEAIGIGGDSKANNSNAIAIGYFDKAGNSSISLGTFVDTENSTNSIGIGNQISIESNRNVVIGYQSSVSGEANVIIGDNASCFYDEDGSNIAIGKNASVYGGDFGIALGDGAVANRNLSNAIGFRSRSDSQSVAYGYQSKAESSRTTAIGPEAESLGERSVSLGSDATSGHGFGYYAADDTVAIGHLSYAKGEGSVSLGSRASSGSIYQNDNYAIAIGYSSYAYGTDAIAVGRQSTSSGRQSVSIGYQARGFGSDSVVIGPNNTTFYSDDTIVIGKGILTSNGDTYGSDSVIAIGENVRIGTEKDTSDSIAIGVNASAQGNRAISIGPSTKALNNNSVALGGAAFSVPYRLQSDGSTSYIVSSEALNNSSTALGPRARSSADFAISIGTGVFSSGLNSIAIGRGANGLGSVGLWATESTGEDSIALGTQSAALADRAVQIAKGINNTANTLQYLSNTIANSSGIEAPVFAGTPTTSPREGSIAVDNTSGSERLCAYVNGSWKCSALT